MKHELIIVRYGEISLKGKETRKYFEKYLINNIKKSLDTKKISHEIKKERGRIYVYTNQIKKSTYVLQKIFGIVSISPAFKTKSDMNSISKLAVNLSKEILTKDNSFAVRSTRTGKHDYTSQDVCKKIGSDIIDTTHAKVNLSKPNFELFIEIRNDKAYLFIEKLRGPGGMPLGTQGKILVLIDNMNSLLAAWYMMRRGCETVFAVTDNSFTGALKDFTSNWHSNLDFYQLNSNEKNFYKNLNKIAKEKNCNAVAIGYYLSNGSRGELKKIKSFTKNISFPILHPLIAMEKDEIYKKSKDIGIKS
ncbi:MAG: hypothetical protein JSW62_00170 [Thermoplasmatales archaeon]|nr:MAG: hypothetical protein JSW62_00170 [Thermoplasmatales archaeon]